MTDAYGPHLPDDYDFPWVRAWGRRIDMTEDQIDRMVTRAQNDRAPHTALVRFAMQDHWMTLDDIVNIESRLWLMAYAEQMGLEIPHSVMAHWLDPDYAPSHQAQPGHVIDL